nr:MAG TPA: hypothetical protein [Caudoviricetes sp.]
MENIYSLVKIFKKLYSYFTKRLTSNALDYWYALTQGLNGLSSYGATIFFATTFN